jgi:hypothetical protein
MNDDNKIKTGSGQFYAVNLNGHLVGANALKPGFRWATADDIAIAEKAESERAAKESKGAKPAGPLAVG